MTEIPTAPVPSAEEEAAFEVMRADAVLTGRAMLSGQACSSAEFLAGLIVAAQVDTAGAPRKLPADMWPDEDPALIQAVWDRACVVATRAAQFAASPRLHGDRLLALQGQLTEAGYHAMGGMVGRSRRLVERGRGAHPADGEDARGHGAV